MTASERDEEARAAFREMIIAIATTIDAVTPQDAQGFFRHCGYRFAQQPS